MSWAQTTLSNLSDIQTGPFGSQLHASDYVDEGIPIIMPQDIIGNRVVTDAIARIREEDAIRLTKYRVQPGDIVYSRRGDVERHALIEEFEKDWLCGTGCLRVRPNNALIMPRYLHYYLSSPESRSWITAHAHGSTMPNLNTTILGEVPICYPNIDEQQAICRILESIDSKIHNNIQINDNLFDQMQSLYKAWFVDYAPFGGTKPASWKPSDIYSLANIIYGAPFTSKQFNTCGNGKPIIRIRDLKDQQFATYTTEEHPKGYSLKAGDIVVGMDGEFRPYIWGNDEAWLNQRVCVFDNKRPHGKAFLYYTIKPLLYAIEQTQVATTVIHIGKKDFDAFEVNIPDNDTLDRFDTITTPMISRIVVNCFENKRLAVVRDALLPKLMTGEIDVSDIQF